MKNERLISILLGILAIIVSTFLFLTTQTPDNKQHREINEHLRQLRSSDALLNQQIITARYRIPHNYDSINDHVKQLQRDVDALHEVSLSRAYQDFSAINKALVDLEQNLDKKFQLIEDFKTDNALFKNSLHHLPHNVAEFVEEARTEMQKEGVVKLNDLLRNILTYNLTQDTELKKDLQNNIKVLQLRSIHYKGASHDHFVNLLHHAELVLNMRDTLDNLLSQVMETPLEEVTAALHDAFFAYYKKRIEMSDTYRVILYLVSTLLLAYLVQVLMKLRTNTRELFQEKERAQITLHSIGDGVITTDAQGLIDYMNPVAETLTGWRTADARGQPLLRVFKIVSEHAYKSLEDPAKKCIKEGRVVEISDHALLRRDDGHESAIENSAAPIRGRDGNIMGAIVVFHDVSKTRSLARELQWHASHDPLTGLANRREFEQRLKQALRSAKELRLEHALLYLDLDQFKIVNDTCGHVVGDELLRQITSLMQPHVRGTDTLARLGGDEFGLLLEICPLDKAERIANQLRCTLQDFRFTWKNKAFNIGGSIGVAPITQQNETIDEILSAADVACYAAKDEGRNRVHVYQADDGEIIKRHGQMQWTARIHHALEENRFLLYSQKIQPILPHQGGVIHHELLLRMIDEKGDVILPGAFIPAAERYNMMPLVDRWVVRTAFKNICALRPKNSGMFMINLSGHSLSDEQFLSFTVNELHESGVLGDQICFEITETAAIANLSSAIKFIGTLKGMGCSFALDDFGMGMSSYAYLKNLPVDYLKIDGTFVKDMADDPVDCEMVRAVNQIAHVMNIKTIAESVESEAIWKKAIELQVDFVQGYHVEKPHLWFKPLDAPLLENKPLTPAR